MAFRANRSATKVVDVSSAGTFKSFAPARPYEHPDDIDPATFADTVRYQRAQYDAALRRSGWTVPPMKAATSRLAPPPQRPALPAAGKEAWNGLVESLFSYKSSNLNNNGALKMAGMWKQQLHRELDTSMGAAKVDDMIAELMSRIQLYKIGD